MAIGVHRERNLRMTEDIHDLARMYALCDQQGRASVAQIVEAQFCGQARPLLEALEIPGEVAGLYRRAPECCEYETPIGPLFASELSFDSLPISMIEQSGERRSRQANGSSRPCSFWFQQLEFASNILQRALDC